jgi:hypothetical protein
LEKPKPDKLHGLRVHCWVLVLAGKREVPESFFLEATTGQSYALDFSGYLGVESIWNNRNYWINMQDCSQGVTVRFGATVMRSKQVSLEAQYKR